MRQTYRPCEKQLDHEEVGKYIGYGLQMLDEQGQVLCETEDLSMDKAQVQQWADAMNEQQLEPIHFWEVIEDLLLL